MRQEIQSVNELQQFAKNFLKKLTPNKGAATVIGLSGELGSGKTTFVQALAAELGITEQVISPTFIIEKIYKLENQAFEYLIHIDAYRLEGGNELKILGFDDIASNPKNLIVIEWPERVADILPQTLPTLSFEHINETTRAITTHQDGKENR